MCKFLCKSVTPPPCASPMIVIPTSIGCCGILQNHRILHRNEVWTAERVGTRHHRQPVMTYRASQLIGMEVRNPEGKELGYIKTELPTNVGFGRGKESKTLYITAGKSLYRIRVGKDGYQLPGKK